MDLPDNSRDLHDSILIDILVKLPLKSLITCKLVCKSWYLLISDSTFGKAYNSIEPFNCSLYFNSRSLYLNETHPRIKDDKTSSNLNLHLPTNENATLRMVGSCNGLCCFLLETRFDEEKIYIYNPLTCEYIEIRDMMKSKCVSRMSFGFGCSTCTNQYKVVRFLPQVDAQVLGSRIQGRVYTVGLDSRWREFKDPCIPHTSDKHPVLLNGVLHWVGFETGPESMMIYAFNVEEEKGKRMELPLDLQSSKSQPFIGILNGHLCALGQKRAYFRVWILEDKGNAKSWTKFFLLRDPIQWYINWWNPGFVCNLATSQHGRKEKIVFTSIGRTYDYCHDLPYVPCFSSLNSLFRGDKDVIEPKF